MKLAVIYRKEMQTYFTGMTGYVFLAVLSLFTGIYFVSYNIYQGYPFFSAVLSTIAVVLLLAVPILTMRSLAEEKKTRTDQMLLTSPITLTDIVLGKYLALITVFGTEVLLASLGPLILRFYGGKGSLLSDYSAVLGFFLLGCAYISIGLFVSSLTESQVVAAVATFLALLILYFMDGLTDLVSPTLFASYAGFCILFLCLGGILYLFTLDKKIMCAASLSGILPLTVLYLTDKRIFADRFTQFLGKLSFADRFAAMANQIFDFTSIFYFISVSALFVFLTVQYMKKRQQG